MTGSRTPAPSPEGSYLTRAFEDDRYAWTRVARTRRRIVLSEVGLVAVLVVLTLFAVTTRAGWSTWYFVVWSVGMLGFIPIHSLLNAGIRGLYDRSGRTLDEHQRRLRERSHTATGWPMTGLMLAAWTGAVAVVAITGHTALALAWGFLLWFGAGLLPYWHLGWTLPDEAAEPE